MSEPTFTCQDCGKEFSLPPAVREKYPTWTPKQCIDCRKGSQGRARSGSKGTAGQAGNSKNGAARTDTTGLSPAEVLKRFEGGPQDGVFTDGSCQGNPGPGGWGAVWVENNDIVGEKFGYEERTTNNRMELTAIIAGLEMLPEDAQTTVYTDSQLVMNTLTKWAEGWEKRGWRRKDGEVKNVDLVQQAYTLYKKRPGVHIEWIRAHDGSRWNEYADALATAHLRGD